MDNQYAIVMKDVSKIYRLKSKEKKHSNDQSFYALKEINLKIPKGEVVGVLGTNGSGKSTMAMVLAQITEISSGQMEINGEQAMISISTGLNGQLTGLENIELKGALLGLKKKRIQEITDRVIDFAEIGDFMYQPVKKYSSGMKSRLGFAINLCLDPDIFIVDEALSVGDTAFAKKCIDRMKTLKTNGKTIVFVSHSLGQIKEFCDTAVWIEGGHLNEYGEVNEVCKHYSEYMEKYNALSDKEKKAMNEERFEKRLVPYEEPKSLFRSIFRSKGVN